MARPALRSLLARIALAALGATAAGCKCADHPVNEYRAIPDGGLDAATGILLDVDLCDSLCHWTVDMLAYRGNAGFIDRAAPHQCRIEVAPGSDERRVFCQYFTSPGACIPAP